jgi:phytoene desaturase
MNRKKVIIIGAGLGGLSTAIYLKSKGYEPEIHEKTSFPGGKAGNIQLGNYRFDTGPSLLTYPQVFDDLFNSLGKRREDYVEFIPLNPITHYWFHDNTKLLSRPLPEFIRELEQSLNIPKDLTEQYFAYAKTIFDLTTPVFLHSSLHERSTWFSKDAFKAYRQIGKVDLFRTMDQSLHRWFKNYPKAIQLFQRFATYNGSDPYQVPATLNNISYLEHGLGGYGVKGGIFALSKGLAQLCKDSDIPIYYNSEVESIQLSKNNSISAIDIVSTSNVTSGNRQSIKTNILVSDVDILTLYNSILNTPEEKEAIRYKNLPPSTSGLVYYLGIKKSFSELGVHNIFFSKDYHKEFSQIHNEQLLPDDPTVYINITSKITPEDAPSDSENWFILINSPPDDGRNWKDIAASYKDIVLNKIEYHLHEPIRDLIEVEDTLTPDLIQHNTGSWRGSLYGISSNTRSAAFLRHSNRMKKYPGLYAVGGSVHPGGGMPLVTLSGKITASLIEKYQGDRE